MAVENPPPGFAGVTAYLAVKDADAAIDWYRRVLDAELLYRMDWQGKVGHAELKIGGGYVMLSDEFEGINAAPPTLGGTSVGLMVYVPDADATYAKALAAGATGRRAPVTEPWGDHKGDFIDPFGHRWSVGTHVEDVSYAELDRRMREMGG